MLSVASKVVKAVGGVALKGAAKLGAAAGNAGLQSLQQTMRASAATLKGGVSIAAGQSIHLTKASFGASARGVKDAFVGLGNSVHSVGLSALEAGVDGASLVAKSVEGVANATLATANAAENLIITGDPRRESQDWLKEVGANFVFGGGGGGLPAPGGGGGDADLRNRVANSSASFRQSAPTPAPAAPPRK